MDSNVIEDRTASVARRTEAAADALAGDAKNEAAKLASQASVAAGDAYNRARDEVREGATILAKSVEQQPLIALLVVGLFCGAVGFLLARR